VEEVEVGVARFVNDNPFAETTQLDSCVVVVGGPDQDGEIVLLAGAETYLPTKTAVRLALEIMRRLGVEGPNHALAAKIDYLVNWADQQGLLPEHVFTFPDGDSWEAKR
jgi:hypothetical protein